MNELQRPNVALALTPNAGWRERYQTRLRELCPDASAEALDSDNDPTMQGRMMGDSPELCAENMAGELMAWSAPNDSSSATAALCGNKCNQSGPPPFAGAHG